MMKPVGIALLAVGVGLSSAYGARLSPSMVSGMRAQGMAQFEQQAFAKYCTARSEAGFAVADGCPDAAAPDMGAPELSSDVRALRDAWLQLRERSAEAAVEAPSSPPSWSERVSEWFSDSGVPFVLGLLLVVVGAVLSRVAFRRAALSGPGPQASAAKAEDFGAALGALRDAMKQLEADMEAPEGKDGQERFKEALEALHYEKFEPLVDARARVQNKYGMAGFAEVFGPLAAGERAANRAWAALVDDHFPEAKASVGRAARELARAHEILSRLVERAA